MSAQCDFLLDGKVRLRQSDAAFRASLDAVLLAAAAPFGERVLDVGAGSGAVALCYGTWHAKSHIDALELQQKAYQLLKDNIRLNGYEKRMRAYHGDLFSVDLASESYDLLLSNPPYLESHNPPSEADGRALAMAERGWHLDDWLEKCFKLTCRKGWVVMIHRSDRLYDILSAVHGKADRLYIYPLFSKSGAEAQRLIVCARKKSSRSSGLAPPLWLRGMVIHKADGSYTVAAEAILRGSKKISIVPQEKRKKNTLSSANRE